MEKKTEIIPCDYDKISYTSSNFSLVGLNKCGKWGIFNIHVKKWLGKGLVYIDEFIYSDRVRVKEQNGNWKDLKK